MSLSTEGKGGGILTFLGDLKKSSAAVPSVWLESRVQLCHCTHYGFTSVLLSLSLALQSPVMQNYVERMLFRHFLTWSYDFLISSSSISIKRV